MGPRLYPADAVLLTVVACFAAGLVALWVVHGFTWSHAQRARRTAGAPRNAAPAREAPPSPRAAAPRRAVPHRPASPHLTLVAVRGALWVSVRAGSPTGRTLFEGLLEPNRRITLPGSRFVARVQGVSNLDAVLGHRRVNLAPYEMRDVLITPAGVRVLAASRPVVAS